MWIKKWLCVHFRMELISSKKDMLLVHDVNGGLAYSEQPEGLRCKI